MALTDLQKAQNKVAQQVRNRAHSARYKLFSEAVSAAENAPEVLQARMALDQATVACDAAAAHRDEQIQRLKAQIAELEEQIVALQKDARFQSMNEERRAAATSWNAIKRAKIDEAEARFPDLQRYARHSSAVWEPPQDVLDAMEEARRCATVDVLKPKKAQAAKA